MQLILSPWDSLTEQNNHCTHFVSYSSLEMGFWKWHSGGSTSVNVSFQLGELSIDRLSKKKMVIGVVGAKEWIERPNMQL